MVRIMGMPGRYIQGYDEILNIEKYISSYASRFLFIIDQFLYDDLSQKLTQILSKYQVVCEKFGGQSCKTEINRLRGIYAQNGLEMVIGIGSGKTIDTAKAVAASENCPVVICPSAASSDAPCSALSVIYKDNGDFEEYVFFKKNPDIVLVDSNICSKAPVRLLVAGMGDALGTYFEALSTSLGNHKNFFNADSTVAGLTLSRTCYELLLSDGYKAKVAVENQRCTRAVENIIEANILLSGLGFESGGLAAAHAIYNALTTVVKETHNYLHGEMVAFGTLVHLILENAPTSQIEEVLEFCLSVGLPVCLADLGITQIDENQIMQVAKAACAVGDTMHNMQFAVNEQNVYDAIITANDYGVKYQNQKHHPQAVGAKA
jgi:glycerol dehydrogenase